jgi:hypothetical protein
MLQHTGAGASEGAPGGAQYLQYWKLRKTVKKLASIFTWVPTVDLSSMLTQAEAGLGAQPNCWMQACATMVQSGKPCSLNYKLVSQ